MSRGTIFNIVRYAIHDGQGIRVTFFFKGCPLRCWWCHNPEAFAAARDPQSTPFPEREMSVDEVLAEIARDQIFIDESGGGATFSGGEPLVQWRFLCEVLRACRRREIHTAIDTTGYAPREAIKAVAELADLFLYDLKLIDPAAHRHYTGVSNELILENLAFLANRGSRVVIRIPLIPGITDIPENIASMMDFLEPLRGLRRINLLPYHKIAVGKYRRLELENHLAGLEPPTPEAIESARALLAGRGFEVTVGG